MANPFYVAQQQVNEDPNAALEEGVPAVPTAPAQAQGSYTAPSMIPSQSGGPPWPDPTVGLNVQSWGGADEIGQLKSSLMQMFPDLTQEEPQTELSTAQKLTLFGLFLVNPSGALDMIRERRERQAKRQLLRAETELKMTGVAAELLKAQHEAQQMILDTRLKLNEQWRREKESQFREHLERGKLAAIQARTALMAQRYADQAALQRRALDMASGAVSGTGPTAGMRRQVTIGPRGATVTLSDPAAPTQRDPRVDFDSWVRSRFPRGVPSRLSKEPEILFDMYKRERQLILQPGSFGAAGAPIGGGYPELFQPTDEMSTEPDILLGDDIESME